MTQLDRRTFVGAAGALAAAPLAASAVVRKRGNPKDKAMTNTEFTTRNSIVMLVDHQVGTLGWVKSIPADIVVTSCRVLAKMALAYDMPLILTTTVEQQVGATIKDLQDIAPKAFAERYVRGGQLDAWDDPKLRAGVAALGRKKIILAGLTTDICMYWAAKSALKLGYEVLVVADACGTTSVQGDNLTYARLRQSGAQISVVNQVVTELANDFSVPHGAKAQQIMAEEIISKL